MIESLKRQRARLASTRRGNPAKALQLVVVAGPYGKSTTIRLLEAILQETGLRVAVLEGDNGYDNSASAFFGRLARLKKKSDVVLIEATSHLLKTGALYAAELDSVVVLGRDATADALLTMTPTHVVSPVDLSPPEGTVAPYQMISFGDDAAADARIERTKLYRHGIEVHLTIDHQTKLTVASYLTGYGNARSIAAAVAAAYLWGIDLGVAQEGIAEVDAVPRRFEVLRGQEPFLVIIDAARDTTSVQLAVSSAKALTPRRLLVAFDDVPASDILTEVKKSANRVYVVDTESRVRGDIDSAVSIKGVVEKATRGAKKGDTVLLLGGGFDASLFHPEESDGK